jgi:hypothetical protein
MNIIFYLFPAIVATGILFKLGFKESYVNLIVFSSFFTVIIYILNYSVLLFGFGYYSIPADTLITSVSFSIKYLVLSMIWAFLLPLTVWNISKNVNLKVKENIIFQKRHKKESK